MDSIGTLFGYAVLGGVMAYGVVKMLILLILIDKEEREGK